MPDAQVIAAIAKAIAATRSMEPNSNDEDFATKFLIAYRTMLALEKKG